MGEISVGPQKLGAINHMPAEWKPVEKVDVEPADLSGKEAKLRAVERKLDPARNSRPAGVQKPLNVTTPTGQPVRALVDMREAVSNKEWQE